MMLVSSIIVAIVMTVLFMTADSLFTEDMGLVKMYKNEKGETKFKTAKIKNDVLFRAGVFGIVIGLINYFSPKATGELAWLAVIFLLLMFGATGYLIWWWKKEGSTFKEFIPFLLMTAILFFTTSSAATMVVGMLKSAFWVAFISKLPAMVAVGSLGFYLANLFFYRKKRAIEDDDAEKAQRNNWGAWIAIILAILLVGSCFFKHCWGALAAPSSDDEPQFPFFYNSLLQDDEDKSNDYDFGPSMITMLQDKAEAEFWEELEAEKAEEEKSDEDAETDEKSEEEIAEEKAKAEEEAKKEVEEIREEIAEAEYTAEDYDRDARLRLKVDPVLGAAWFGYFDQLTNSQILEEYYKVYPDNPMAAMNLATDDFLEHPEKYEKCLEKFFERLDHAEVSLRKGTGIKDQMYMDPFTTDGVPDIVVFETIQDDGLFLVYTLKIKGNDIQVVFRTDCGYQPTDVAKLFGVTPKPHPNKPDPPPSKPDDDDDGPGDNPGNDPGGDPDEPSNPKDPDKGTQGPLVGPNDNPGPGPDTNNGVGAQYSSEQKPDGSIFMDDYDEYKDTMDELGDINDNQLEGGDSNEPSYTPPENNDNDSSNDIPVDNNGDNGTGFGGIDVGTPIAPPAETVGGGNVTDPGAGDSWGGPPDA